MMNFEKSHLQAGYLVELRSGTIWLVTPTRDETTIYDGNGNWFDLSMFSQNLKHEISPKNDIVKVWGQTLYPTDAFDFSTENRELLWEREQKIEYYVQLSENLCEKGFNYFSKMENKIYLDHGVGDEYVKAKFTFEEAVKLKQTIIEGLEITKVEK